jgi:selenide,water dikinase
LGSGLEAEVWAGEVPLLFEKVRELALQGVVPGGSKRNLQFMVEKGVVFEDGLAPEERILLADAQTSGGLLFAVGEAQAPALVAALRARKTPAAATVGRLRAGRPGLLRVIRERPSQQLQ